MGSQASKFADSELLDARAGDGVNGSPQFTDITPLASSPHGYALLFKAKRMGKWHVLKCLRASHADHPLYLGLLRKEFDIGYPLQSPNIVQTIGLEQVPGLGLCIVEEYVDGQPLQTVTQGDATIQERMAHKIIAELCDALTYIHARQIVHRDLKPQNILLTSNGQNVKLIDFGYADADSYAVLKQPAGTRRYAAPEQVRGEQVDARADIYALGHVVSELNDRLLHPTRHLRRIADKCRQADKERRFQSAAEVKEALLHRSHARAIALAALLVALILAVGLWLQSRFSSQSPSEETRQTAVEAIQDTLSTQTPAPQTEPEDQHARPQSDTPDKAADQPSNATTTSDTTSDTTNADPAMLELRIKKKTKEILEEAYRKISDASLPMYERLDSYGQSFTQAELMVRREVDAAYPTKDDANRQAQTEMHELMRQTYKQYNLDNHDRITRLMQAAQAEQQHKK